MKNYMGNSWEFVLRYKPETFLFEHVITINGPRIEHEFNVFV